jgi:phosphoglycolate phosphatase
LYDVVLFDLDGTLTDSKTGIVNAVQYALGELGLPPADESKIVSYIGGPFREELRRIHGFDEATTARFVDAYRRYYAERGIFENAPYEGAAELLAGLHASGTPLAVATAKPTALAEQVLRQFDLLDYFTSVVGAHLDGGRSLKADLIRDALARLQACRTPSETTAEGPPGGLRAVMVGDRSYDMLGAKANQIDSIAVTYGYGSVDELRACGPTHLADSPQAVGRLLAASEA